MTDWIKACSTDNLGQGEMFSFDHNEKKLLLTNMNGKIFATDRTCTHAAVSYTHLTLPTTPYV